MRNELFLTPLESLDQTLRFRDKKKPNLSVGLSIALRRKRDSNPRYLAVQWFSRPPHSTTLPSLLCVSDANVREKLNLQTKKRLILQRDEKKYNPIKTLAK